MAAEKVLLGQLVFEKMPLASAADVGLERKRVNWRKWKGGLRGGRYVFCR